MHHVDEFLISDQDIRERTIQGLEAAKRAGQRLGRQPKLNPSRKVEIIRMIEDKLGTPAHAVGVFNVSKATVKRVVAAHRSAERATK